MQQIDSFLVDHLVLEPGLYVSRTDSYSNITVTTFDMRITRPNKEPVMDMPAIHTIEHLGATFLRNSARKDEILYFGPMGCRTGFYLLMFGELTATNIMSLVLDMCEFICTYEGKIVGATPKECGNYLEHNLTMAKYYIRGYKRVIEALQRDLMNDYHLRKNVRTPRITVKKHGNA